MTQTKIRFFQTTDTEFVNKTGDSMTGALDGNAASSFSLRNSSSSATVPTVVPNKSDLISGMGGAAGTVSIISGSFEMGQFDDDVGITLIADEGAGSNGGLISLSAGAGSVATGLGGAIDINAGAGNTTGVGGAVTIDGGTGGADGTGGAITLTGGDGGATSGNGGRVDIDGGDAATDGSGGTMDIRAGNAAGATDGGGPVFLIGGTGAGTGNGGSMNISGGVGGSGATGDGGAASFGSGAAGSGTANSNNTTILSGSGGGTSGNSGNILIKTGSAGGTAGAILFQTAGSNTRFQITGTTFEGINATGPSISNVASNLNTASLLPDKAQTTSGVGSLTGGFPTMVTGGTWQTVFGNGGHALRTNGDIATVLSNGPLLANITTGATSVSLLPNRTDVDTGVGQNLSDSLHIITGGVEATRWEEASSEVIQVHQTTTGITASGTQTQAGGTALLSSFNDVTTVAVADDTVTAFAAAAGRHLWIFNAGANPLRIFPAVGDDLGNTVDTFMTLAVSTGAMWIAADATNWRQFTTTAT